MKKNIPNIKFASSFTVILNGKPMTMSNDNPNYKDALVAVANGDADTLEQLFDIGLAITKFSTGKLNINSGVVKYGTFEVHNSLAKRIVELMREGAPFEPLARFLNNLMENPSSTCVDQLYSYIERYKLPITDDGCFLGMKAVRNDFLDKYSGTVSYKPGTSVEMPRNQCDDNRDAGCSRGLHLGNFEYVRGYGSSDSDRFVLVKVNPKDVVSCPTDSSYQKMRVARLEVVAELDREEIEEFDSNYAPKTKQYKKATYHNKRDASGRFTKK
jgi:hypothetical protein